jgi:hypothetical protein
LSKEGKEPSNKQQLSTTTTINNNNNYQQQLSTTTTKTNMIQLIKVLMSLYYHSSTVQMMIKNVEDTIRRLTPYLCTDNIPHGGEYSMQNSPTTSTIQ